jgi:tRNA isopentenyl-2-thiomethyl-A-37 hydroxylase MiaE
VLTRVLRQILNPMCIDAWLRVAVEARDALLVNHGTSSARVCATLSSPLLKNASFKYMVRRAAVRKEPLEQHGKQIWRVLDVAYILQ